MEGSLRNPLLCDRSVEWSTPGQRRERVAELHSDGDDITRIAKKLRVCRRTVIRDCDLLELSTFTLISDEDLEATILDIIQTLSSSIGLRSIEGCLISRGLRIQERRITSAMVNVFQYHSEIMVNTDIFLTGSSTSSPDSAVI